MRVATARLAVILLCSYSAVVRADSADLNPMTVVGQCNSLIDTGTSEFTEAEIVNIITNWKNMANLAVARNAARCVSTLTSQDWEYDRTIGEFIQVPDDVLAQRELERRADEQHRLEMLEAVCQLESKLDEQTLIIETFERQAELRRDLVVVETLSACIRLYEDEPDEALLNPICNRLFAEHGVPIRDNEVSLEEYDAAMFAAKSISIEIDNLMFSGRSQPTQETAELEVSDGTTEVEVIDKCQQFR